MEEQPKPCEHAATQKLRPGIPALQYNQVCILKDRPGADRVQLLSLPASFEPAFGC